MENENLVCWDIETLASLFTACFLDIATNKRKSFIIHREKSELKELLAFLDACRKNKYKFIGFNNVYFDAQVIEFIWQNKVDLLNKSNSEVIDAIYGEAQRVVSLPDETKYLNLIPEWKLTFPQIDLYLLNHYNNQNKRTSLKYLEFTLRMDDIREMPILHDKKDIKLEEVDDILFYNWVDVNATKTFYDLNIPAIELREKLRAKYNLNCINWNSGKIGENILLDIYCKKTKRDKKEVRKLNTIRHDLKIKDIIFPYIQFKTKEFNDVKKRFEKLVVNSTKSEDLKDEFRVKYRGLDIFYGLGGVHASQESGIFESDEEWMIIDGDVAGLYPSIIVQNKLYPAHLGEEFYEVYKNDIVDIRLAEKLKPKKEQNKQIIAALKEAGNIPFGKSMESRSWLYDNAYGLGITINGQLLITMWSELLYDIPDILVIQKNTDGTTCRIKRKYESLYYEKCKEFEKLTGFTLEYANYNKMIILTVNDYLAIKDNGEIKRKGDFDYVKEWHKNNSMLIVPKALEAYFVSGVDIRDFIKNPNNNILDFCKGVKVKSDFKLDNHHMRDGVYTEEHCQKVTRYFISTDGGNLVKFYPKTDKRKERLIDVESGWKSTTCNNLTGKSKLAKDYPIDYRYYIEKAEKILLQVEGNKLQLELF